MACALHDGAGHRVRRSRFHRGRPAQHVVARPAVPRLDVIQAHLAQRQRPGLVEGHRVHRRQPLEHHAALDQHAAPRRGRQRRHDRHRRRDHERARAGDHQEHQAAVDPHPRIAAGQRRDHGHDQGRQRHQRRVPPSEALDECLQRRPARLRLLHQVRDAGHARVGPDAGHAHVQRAVAVDRAREHLRIDRLLHRQRLAGQRRFVHLAAPVNHDAVDRHAVARTHQHGLAERHRLHRHPRVVAAAAHHRLARRQVQQGANRMTGTLQRARLEPLRERKQEHDAGRFGPFADRQGTDDGEHHQDVDVQAARAHRGDGPARRRRDPSGHGRQIGHGRHAGHARPFAAQAQAQRSPRRQRQPRPSGAVGASVGRGLVLEPHAQARVSGRIHHRRGRESCGVIGDAQALRHDVGRQRLHARQRLQPALQDGHLVAAVQALHPEHRLGVVFAHRARRLGAGGHRASTRRSSSAWRRPSWYRASTWVSSSA